LSTYGEEGVKSGLSTCGLWTPLILQECIVLLLFSPTCFSQSVLKLIFSSPLWVKFLLNSGTMKQIKIWHVICLMLRYRIGLFTYYVVFECHFLRSFHLPMVHIGCSYYLWILHLVLNQKQTRKNVRTNFCHGYILPRVTEQYFDASYLFILDVGVVIWILEKTER